MSTAWGDRMYWGVWLASALICVRWDHLVNSFFCYLQITERKEKNLLTLINIFLIFGWKKFKWFQDLLNKIMLPLSKKVIFYSKAFLYPPYKKVFIGKNPKVRFSDLQNSKKHQKYKNSSKIPEWFSITTIVPIRFMKMFWLISASWSFQNCIGSGMAFRWSDTPQYNGIVQWSAVH